MGDLKLFAEDDDDDDELEVPPRNVEAFTDDRKMEFSLNKYAKLTVTDRFKGS